MASTKEYLLSELVRAMYEELPVPREKKKGSILYVTGIHFVSR